MTKKNPKLAGRQENTRGTGGEFGYYLVETYPGGSRSGRLTESRRSHYPSRQTISEIIELFNGLGYDTANIRERTIDDTLGRIVKRLKAKEGNPILEGDPPMFRMVPSGDIVDWEERNRRLGSHMVKNPRELAGRRRNPTVTHIRSAPSQLEIGAWRAIEFKVDGGDWRSGLVVAGPDSKGIYEIKDIHSGERFYTKVLKRGNPILEDVIGGVAMGTGFGVASAITTPVVVGALKKGGKVLRGRNPTTGYTLSMMGHRYGVQLAGSDIVRWYTKLTEARIRAKALAKIEGDNVFIHDKDVFAKYVIDPPKKRGNPGVSGTPKGYQWEVVIVAFPVDTWKVEDTYHFEAKDYQDATRKAKNILADTRQMSQLKYRSFDVGVYNKGVLKGWAVWESPFAGNVRNIRFHRHKSGSRRNPGSAEGLFEEFHGRPSGEELIVGEEEKYRDDLAVLGELRELVVVEKPKGKRGTPVVFDGDDNVMLASTPSGNQYLFVGGDQRLEPRDFGVREKKDKVSLGWVHSVTYYTDKQHLSGPKDAWEYEHKFGEEGGELPMLVYDRLNERMELVGGSYKTTGRGIED